MFSALKNTFIHPLKEIVHDSRSIGIILLTATFFSLIIANIPSINSSYINFWNNSFDGSIEHHIHIGSFSLPNSLLLIINDFLMAFFFFLVGMEIKREFINGELSSFKKSLLPIIAAIGGMLMPAILFFIVNHNHQEYIHGWAIPTATDIAFTLGVASLLGKRVPVALKIFITALAIIDDLGAIIVIAIFYGSKIKLLFIVAALCVTIFIIILNKLKITFGILHILLAIMLWYCMFNSGIHATIAGVIVALLVPVKQLAKLEMKLHTPVYFFILPIFALANTAITIPNNMFVLLTSHLSWGIFVGLIIGKPLGICLISWIMMKMNVVQLPTNTNWQQMIGAGILCGIGFTMSIFIATLSYKDVAYQNTAKITVLIASLTAIVIGFIWLKLTSQNTIIMKEVDEELNYANIAEE
ncbi:MAG: Na+/H+ antiporter NhaA [Chitinophagaceae bacterium]|nr:Na+/H+ antiporter NhaA [Chitinophagaceae bacterium]MCW5905536.1 Na+/H+ antiporter NhaA [Chitinophagaceae bacterium]